MALEEETFGTAQWRGPVGELVVLIFVNIASELAESAETRPSE